jgi:cell division protein FtsB
MYAIGVVFFALILDGSLFQYWTLVGEHQRLEQGIRSHEKMTQELNAKIKQAKSLEFIEHQARDRLDLVDSDELVFVFSDDGV